ncbi:MAG: hypothetical protein KDA84_19025, partial [Planctomycetaceae bacterium]|nr:hypothetical protein [Planctomycetaceae bacterium]
SEKHEASQVSQSSPDRQVKEPLPERKILRERPDEYLEWNLNLRNAEAGNWRETIEPLKEQGDQYTLWIISKVLEEKPANVSVPRLKELAAHIQKKHPKESIKSWEVQFLLERAAYADLQCHFLEHSLRRWTLETLRRFRDTLEIREELEYLRDNYQTQIDTENLIDEESLPSGIDAELLEKNFVIGMKHRVVRYINDILRENEQP